MRISRQLLQYVVPQLKTRSTKDIADALVALGIEISSLRTMTSPAGLVAGKITQCEKIAGSTKLTLCEVQVGSEKLQIVCGAPNVAAGMMVVVAKPGTVLPDGKKIERRAVGTTMSDGMICGINEIYAENLFTSAQTAGIIEMPAGTKIGETDIYAKLFLNDDIFDVDIATNRPDLNAAAVIAYELSAFMGLESPKQFDVTQKTVAKRHLLENPAYFSAYHLLNVKGIKVGPSPEWMRGLLVSCGIRSLNNVVDALQLVALLSGVPLHAYDAMKLKQQPEPKLVTLPVSFKALDNKEYLLQPADIAIYDGEQPVAIAGIIGNLDSAVSATTTEIIIELAEFAAASIKRAMEHSVVTAAGLLSLKANTRALTHYAMTTVGDVFTKMGISEPVLIFNKESDPKLNEPIKLNVTWLNNLLGTKLKFMEVVLLLRRAGFKFLKRLNLNLNCIAPPWRSDINNAHDIAEEVARLIGPNDLPALPPQGMFMIPAVRPIQKFATIIHDTMVESGFQEVLTYSLTSAALNAPVSAETYQAPIVIANAPSNQRTELRLSLLPSLAAALVFNKSHKAETIMLYEVSQVHMRSGSGSILAAMMWGTYIKSPAKQLKVGIDYAFARGILNRIISLNGLQLTLQKGSSNSFFHPKVSLTIMQDGEAMGHFGQIHPLTARMHQLPADTYALELRLDGLKLNQVPYQPVSAYPSASRDFAFAISASWSGNDDLIRNILLLENVIYAEFFDVFSLNDQSTSYGVRVTMQSKKSSLNETTINTVSNQVTALIKAQGGEVR